ncbi:hypothetical protein ykris0001_39350 [Yersinia kristensenii ATCC 33638]|nr:hypothetical protein ykris0001_39350 [Yersinia kristensenii ATCC 33638]
MMMLIVCEINDDKIVGDKTVNRLNFNFTRPIQDGRITAG